MEKCTTCQFYDRRQSIGGNGAPQTGQCRRTAPLLNPVNAKPYVIEGIWPTVRDDDWCGEWKIVPRRADSRPVEPAHAAALGPKAVATPIRPAASTGLSAFGRPALNNVTPIAAVPGND